MTPSLPTDLAEVPAWLRARCDEHASVYDIVVYGRPETWLQIAGVLSCAQSTGAGDAISLTDPAVIIAGIRQFGLAPDGSDLRDLERAIDRLAAAPATPPLHVIPRWYADLNEAHRAAAIAAMPARWEGIEDVPCRFGCKAATSIYYVPKGCSCWADPVQALCEQHAIKAQSEGPITLIARRDRKEQSQ